MFGTGPSVEAIVDKPRRNAREKLPHDRRVATAYCKPGRNRADFEPDFRVHRTDDRPVFPPEMKGPSQTEMCERRPQLARIVDAPDGVAEPAKLGTSG